MVVTRGSVEPQSIVKALFGRPTRVAVALWVLAHDASFYLSEAQLSLQLQGYAASAVATELRTLTKYGMLTEFPDGSRVYFTRTDSTYWAAFAEIGRATGFEV